MHGPTWYSSQGKLASGNKSELSLPKEYPDKCWTEAEIDPSTSEARSETGGEVALR